MGEHESKRSRRASRAFSAVTALAVTALVGCVGPDPFGGAVERAATPAARTCGAASYSCSLPFPSERWLLADASTATGVRLAMPANTVAPSVLAQLGPRDEIAEGMIGADGFSPLTPILFQLPEPLGDGSVPEDGGSVVRVVDLTTGTPVPVRAEVSPDGVDERGAHNIVRIWPRYRFEYGHRIVAALTRGVRTETGGQASAAPSRDEASAATRDAVAAAGVDWNDVLTATTFTVRSEASITADVDRMAARVRAADHPIRNIEVRPSLVGGAAAVSGQVRVTDFRSPDGVISRGGAAEGHDDLWVDFMLVLPERSAAPGGAPVVIYGHGITVSKETMLVVAGQNAAHGFATIGIDDPNHGSRINEGGHILDLAYPVLLGRVESLLLQAELDHISLLRAIQTHLGSLDVLPRNWLQPTGGDGVADLDTTRILYEGTSLGGVLGATFLALAPEVQGAFMQVPGSGIMDVLTHGLVWEMFRAIVPVGAPLGETQVLTYLAQGLLDRADNTYYLDRLRRSGMPVFVSYAVDDGIVGNRTTERMLHLLDLPLVGPQYGPLPTGVGDRRLSTMPADGRGFGQIPTGDLYGNILKPLLAHVEFLNPISVDALDQWLVGRQQALGLR